MVRNVYNFGDDSKGRKRQTVPLLPVVQPRLLEDGDLELDL